ncbi:glycoside hydrolase family 104 protein [Acinetobacter sp. Marseille-Q1618]|uniref:glycoside hydrolase family 24 protein n=1 Tax=Acinetobacter sp. Marseille-Q1618 TaxID=2697502 RepID=UPI00156DAD2F|nr:glycoside hydrolase family 104 protein [Acinetobacter sp. Marseille-Q1618]
MATLKELQEALANPNVRKMLNTIAASEGVKHGYNTLFGNELIQNLSAHPNIKKRFTQTDGKTNVTTAAGRYQFLNGTWNNVAQQYGLRDFSPRNQDLGAIALIAGRGALDDVIKGNYRQAILKLGPEWASLPSSTYKQGKRSWEFINKQLGTDVGHEQISSTSPPKMMGKISADDFQKIISGGTSEPKVMGKISAEDFQKIMGNNNSKPQLMGKISATDFQKIMAGNTGS